MGYPISRHQVTGKAKRRMPSIERYHGSSPIRKPLIVARSTFLLEILLIHLLNSIVYCAMHNWELVCRLQPRGGEEGGKKVVSTTWVFWLPTICTLMLIYIYQILYLWVLVSTLLWWRQSTLHGNEIHGKHYRNVYMTTLYSSWYFYILPRLLELLVIYS